MTHNSNLKFNNIFLNKGKNNNIDNIKSYFTPLPYLPPLNSNNINMNTEPNKHLINHYSKPLPLWEKKENLARENFYNSINKTFANPDPNNLNTILYNERKILDDELFYQQAIYKKDQENKEQIKKLAERQRQNDINLNVENVKDNLDYMKLLYNKELRSLLKLYKKNSCKEALNDMDQIQRILEQLEIINEERENQRNHYIKSKLKKSKLKLINDRILCQHNKKEVIIFYKKFQAFQEEILNELELNQKMFDNNMKSLQDMIVKYVKNEPINRVDYETYDYKTNKDNLKEYSQQRKILT